jgi:hypothetical protein
VAEWFKAAVLKTVVRKHRGFESLLLLHSHNDPSDNRIADGTNDESASVSSGEVAEWLKAPVC